MTNNHTATAIFAAGCFWGVEESFRTLTGVLETKVGYIGGTQPDPTYKQVCTGTTGHAEAVQVRFDPQVITYQSLLKEFFACHDATQVNRQGVDVGTQYRSGIFYCDDQQRILAEQAITEQQQREARKIATELTPASQFYLAEDYHQLYFVKNPNATCHVIKR